MITADESNAIYYRYMYLGNDKYARKIKELMIL